MPFIDHYLVVWRHSIESLITFGEELTESDWATPTRRQDWCVQDVYAHLIGGERWLLAGAQCGYDAAGWPDRPVLAPRRQFAAAVPAEPPHRHTPRVVGLGT